MISPKLMRDSGQGKQEENKKISEYVNLCFHSVKKVIALKFANCNQKLSIKNRKFHPAQAIHKP